MAQIDQTWWGQRFLQTLEHYTDSGRLSRGRSYSGSKIKTFEIDRECVVAQVRGSVNPYFGVHQEPLYTTVLAFEPISRDQWTDAIARLAAKASTLSKLLLGEIPDDIEDTFAALDLHLLPHGKDFHSECTCPDTSNPCKHVAGVYYRLADELNRDPLQLFELRGLSRQDLQAELAKTPLGKALSQELETTTPEPLPVAALYTQPQPVEASRVTLKTFWQGERQLPAIEASEPTPVSAILIKKQGDYPPFWQRENSFVEVMEEFYERVRSKNQDILS
ncbi:SWIM zinc finger family protein [Romeria aff. gracilis LEGE 07310]|uniref:SWIM zinc finger family protein n=1 Tax=Vasconcelosia minhoensis LEGE 07310 TaxID=915328 RepID=A0A8J7AKE1_9CYAN|nr:SWIM zinc finger family protein [Romeria gracilis]MBE9079333.1 SWIM zinc finger family protein [Romeria aff. gracilis LEGE 07310]